MGRPGTNQNGKNARKGIHLCTKQFSAGASTNEECTPSLRAYKRAL